MKSTATIEKPFQQETFVILAMLLGLTIAGWGLMYYQATGMTHGHMGANCLCLPSGKAWTLLDFLNTFFMWAVMMMAMMIPSALPMILLFVSVYRKQGQASSPVAPWLFVAGYIIIWTGFSLFASALQWYLHMKAWLSPMMINTNLLLGGMVLLGAGLYQWTPFKDRCLAYCQSPFTFLMTHWQAGKRGALVMGLKHGLFCTGCCWFLMMILFVVGIMNLLWIAMISILVLLEKITPKKFYLSPALGLLLVGWGLFLISRS